MSSDTKTLIMTDEIKYKIGEMLGVDLSMNKKMTLTLNDFEPVQISVEEGYFCHKESFGVNDELAKVQDCQQFPAEEPDFTATPPKFV